MSVVAATIEPLDRAPLRQRLLWPYVLVLVAGAIGVAALASKQEMLDRPLLLAGLVAAFVALQHVEADLFDGGHIVATTLPTLVLAIAFGPAAPILAEGVGLLVLLLTRDKLPQRLIFDFGALGLAGAAAAVVAGSLPDSGEALALTGLAAGATFVTINQTLLIAVWALDQGRSVVELVRERWSSGVPHDLALGVIAGLLVHGGQRMGPAVAALVGVPVVALWMGQKHSTAIVRRSVEELEAANERQRTLIVQTVESLARTIEARDPYTGGHTERVGGFALMLARRLRFTADELRAVAVGAVIHDIGKIGIPDAVLLKEGPLDEAEWQWMRRHPEIGAYILSDLDIPEIAKEMATYHHERYDGGGYPAGLAGEGIPLAARVLTVADALDAMTSDRPYRRALSFHAALEEIRATSGTQFCPVVVEALLACREAGELDLTSA